MDDKPKMYRCEATKHFTNNKSVYKSYNDNNTKIYDRNEIHIHIKP